MKKQPSKIVLFQYSFLALPLAFAGLPLYIHAPDFYTRKLGLNLGLIGLILLGVRLIDALQDPWLGYLSDQYTNKRFALIISGSALLMMGMMAIFYGPILTIPTELWFAVSMILATTGFSLVTINLNTLGGFWKKEPEQRTRISAWRESFTLLGLLIASSIPSALVSLQSQQKILVYFFWIFAIFLLIGLFAFRLFVKNLDKSHHLIKIQTQSSFAFWQLLNGPDRSFFAICFLTYFASAMPAVMFLFFINDYLKAQNFSGYFLFLYFISGAILMPIWVKLSIKIGKSRAWFCSMLLASITFIWAFFLQPSDILAYSIICILSGMALGADLSLPPSLLADRVSIQKTEYKATQYYALLALIPKLALAFASGIVFLILHYLGFAPGKINPHQSLQGVLILYSLIPCLLKLITAGFLWRRLILKGQ